MPESSQAQTVNSFYVLTLWTINTGGANLLSNNLIYLLRLVTTAFLRSLHASCLPSKSRNSEGERCSSVCGWPLAPDRITPGSPLGQGFHSPSPSWAPPCTSCWRLPTKNYLRAMNFFSRIQRQSSKQKLVTLGKKIRQENT